MPDLPSPSYARTYDWTGHAALLRAQPDVWHQLEEHIPSAWSSLIRNGDQPDLAPLLGHLDVRMRGTHLDGRTRVGALWARYAPREKIEPKRNAKRRTYAALSDDDVLTIRRRAADGEPIATLAAEYGASANYVRQVVRGNYRADVGGPIRT